MKKIALCYEAELIEIAKKYPSIQIIKRDKLTAKKDGPLTFIFKEIKRHIINSSYVFKSLFIII